MNVNLTHLSSLEFWGEILWRPIQAIILGGIILMPQAVLAQNDMPVEITADNTLEWLQNEKKYVARGNVIATQGTTEIRSDILTAEYTQRAEKSNEIQKLIAEGNVTIIDRSSTAHGDRATYDVPEGYALLTGKNLKLVTPDQTITASEKLEYWSQKKKAVATGHARVVRPQDSIAASVLKAFFTEDPATKKSEITRLEAYDNVIITTADEEITGDRAVYNAAANTAEVTGNVRINRGPNHLEGQRAEVNLTTNISKMFGGEPTKDKDGRVRGVFFPGSQKPETAVLP